jgi:hypothetical protein
MVEIRQPQLISEFSDTKEVFSDEDFELVCESDKPVHWFYPRLEFSREEVQCELLISNYSQTPDIVLLFVHCIL